MHEHAPAGHLLLERVVDRQHRRRDDVLVVDVRHHADDAPRLRAEADEPHDRIAPRSLRLSTSCPGKQLLGEALADDHDPFGAVAVVVVEVAAGHDRHAERGEVIRATRTASWRERLRCWPDGVSPSIWNRESALELTAVSPRHRTTDRDLLDAGQPADAFLHLAIEVARLLGRLSKGRDRHVDREDAGAVESRRGRLECEKCAQQHHGTRDEHERCANLGDRERVQPMARPTGNPDAAAASEPQAAQPIRRTAAWAQRQAAPPRGAPARRRPEQVRVTVTSRARTENREA